MQNLYCNEDADKDIDICIQHMRSRARMSDALCITIVRASTIAIALYSDIGM